MAVESVEYRGYRLDIYHSGPGWKVFIYAPGSRLAQTDIPNNRDPSGKDRVIAEAQAIVDRELGSP